MIFPWVAGGIPVGVVLGYALGRFAKATGIAIVLMSAAPMAALFAYSAIARPTGDPSSAGMLSTLILMLVAPIGFTIFLTGLLRSE